MSVEQNGNAAAAGPVVPRWLVVVGSWSWRLVFTAAAVYILVAVVRMLSLLAIALIAALLLTAILRPVAARLRRRLPGPPSALLTLLLALAVLSGITYFIVWRAIEGVPQLVDAFVSTVQDIRSSLSHLTDDSGRLDQLTATITDWLQRHRGDAVDIISTSAGYVVEAVAALLLAMFVTFFLLYDAERIWQWLLRFVGERHVRQVDRAGRVAWRSITGYVRGTVLIAVIHGVVIGTVMLLIGTPMPWSLALLVFLGSFVPLIGALVAGGLAVLVTFSSQGWLAALILFAVLIAENQLEAHVLQPLIMGRNVQLHPLAIGLVVTAGTLIGGIVGALIAVPVAAMVYRAGPILLGVDPDSRESSSRAPAAPADPP